MNHIERIEAHLAHAKEKHPKFADVLDYSWNKYNCGYVLSYARRTLSENSRIGWTSARMILDCELAEVYEAVANGRAEDAVEECYDACAVLLRMAEWIAERGCK